MTAAQERRLPPLLGRRPVALNQSGYDRLGLLAAVELVALELDHEIHRPRKIDCRNHAILTKGDRLAPGALTGNSQPEVLPGTSKFAYVNELRP